MTTILNEIPVGASFKVWGHTYIVLSESLPHIVFEMPFFNPFNISHNTWENDTVRVLDADIFYSNNAVGATLLFRSDLEVEYTASENASRTRYDSVLSRFRNKDKRLYAEDLERALNGLIKLGSSSYQGNELFDMFDACGIRYELGKSNDYYQELVQNANLPSFAELAEPVRAEISDRETDILRQALENQYEDIRKVLRTLSPGVLAMAGIKPDTDPYEIPFDELPLECSGLDLLANGMEFYRFGDYVVVGEYPNQYPYHEDDFVDYVIFKRNCEHGFAFFHSTSSELFRHLCNIGTHIRSFEARLCEEKKKRRRSTKRQNAQK